MIVIPNKPLRPCNKIGCNEITKNGLCPKHEEERKEKRKEHIKNNRSKYDKRYDQEKRNEKSKSFYNSRDWKRVRKAVLVRDNYLCQYCLRDKKISKADVVDHVIPLLIDWSLRLDESNLNCLCHTCHNSKTQRDERNYGKG